MSKNIKVGSLAPRANETRNNNMRAASGREVTGRLVSETLKRKYEKIINKDRLELPQSVVDRFRNNGMRLSWMRWKNKRENEIDYERIFQVLREYAGELVKPSDIPELQLGFTTVAVEGYGDMITRGDLALVQTPIEEYEARVAVKEDVVRQVTEGILHDERKPNGVKSSVQTMVKTGGPRFQED